MKIHALQTGTVRVKSSQHVGRGRGSIPRVNILLDRTWTVFIVPAQVLRSFGRSGELAPNCCLTACAAGRRQATEYVALSKGGGVSHVHSLLQCDPNGIIDSRSQRW
jgi:hypothetical protein